MSVFGTLSPLLPESAHGLTHVAHHKITDHLSFLVLFSRCKTVCAFCQEEAPTPPPPRPSHWLPGDLVLIRGLEKTCVRASIVAKPGVCVPIKSYGRGYGIFIPITRTELWEWEGIRKCWYEKKRNFFFEKRYHVGEAVRVTKWRNFCVLDNLKT